MKIFTSSAITLATAAIACEAFAQAAAKPAAPAAEPAPATISVASNDDRSYLADFEGKNAQVGIFNEKTKNESSVSFKSANDSEIVFTDGGAEVSISKKKSDEKKVVAKLDNNWIRARNAYNRGSWDESIAYMRAMVYPLLPLMSLPAETFKGYVYLDMYLTALVNANRLKEANSIIESLPLGDCAPALVSSAMNVASALAEAGKTKEALDIVERTPFTGEYVSVVPDLMDVLAILRQKGKVKECLVYYTKLMNAETPSKVEATLWMVYCDLTLGKKMSAEIYLTNDQMNKLEHTAREFSLLRMDKGMLAQMAAKPDLNTVLDLYAEGIVFGSLSDSWMPELLYKAGMVYKKLGRQYAANEIFAQMAALYPDDSFTKEGQKEIVKIEKKKKAQTSDDEDEDDE